MRWLVYILVDIVLGGIMLLPTFIAWKKAKKPSYIQISQEGYILYISQQFFWYGVGISGSVFVITVLLWHMLTEILLVATFAIIGLLGTYLSIYSLYWRMVVDNEEITIYRPFLSIKHIKFYEISKIEFRPFGMIGYTKRGKKFVIDKEAVGYEILYNELYSIGKMEPIPKKENFIITVDKETKIRDIFGTLLFGGLLFAIFYVQTMAILYYVTAIVLAGFSICGLLNSVIWKMTVSFHSFEIRTVLKGKKNYKIKDITMVYMKQDEIIIYVGEKKLIAIPSNYSNFSCLLKRLEDEEVVFYSEQTRNY